MTEPTMRATAALSDLPNGTSVVQLLVSDELIAALQDWSNPVQVRIEADTTSPTGWSMYARTVLLADVPKIEDRCDGLGCSCCVQLDELRSPTT